PHPASHCATPLITSPVLPPSSHGSALLLSLSFSIPLPPPPSTLFPYTTLFRSLHPLPFDAHLREHREFHPELRGAERLDLLVRPGLLCAEVVRRKPEDRESLVLELLVQLLETIVLRRVSALRRDIHDQEDFAFV